MRFEIGSCIYVYIVCVQIDWTEIIGKVMEHLVRLYKPGKLQYAFRLCLKILTTYY